jgi:hypothetical protein
VIIAKVVTVGAPVDDKLALIYSALEPI